ncbi:unannotated protein [freshwater metagenome]|uniref:Unannotated protein n=1 Tax=freshwater metagenome TaxID=449393 RepID=A0A6J7AA32_9ZZZZ
MSSLKIPPFGPLPSKNRGLFCRRISFVTSGSELGLVKISLAAAIKAASFTFGLTQSSGITEIGNRFCLPGSLLQVSEIVRCSRSIALRLAKFVSPSTPAMKNLLLSLPQSSSTSCSGNVKVAVSFTAPVSSFTETVSRCSTESSVMTFSSSTRSATGWLTNSRNGVI